MDAVSPLARVDRARQLLSEARTIDEIKEVRDMAEAARMYARQRGMTIEIQNYAAEIKLRAERKAGQILKDIPKNKGAAQPRDDTVSSRGAVVPTLSEMGIQPKQSERWQSVAEIPEEIFETAIEETKAHAALAIDGGRPDSAAVITTAGMLRVAEHLRQEQEQQQLDDAIETLPEAAERLRVAKLRHNVAQGVKEARELFRLNPDSVADIVTDGQYSAILTLQDDADRWFTEVQAAKERGLRLVQGGR